MSDQPPIDPWEERLRRAARSMAYPPTPDLAGAVRQQLALPQRTGRGRQRLAWALVLLLLLSGALLVPEVRAALRSILRIGAVELEITTATPPRQGLNPLPTQPAQSPTPLPADSLLNLSGETTLEQARSALDFPIHLPAYPADLGLPDRVFVQGAARPREEQSVILLWLDPAHPAKIIQSLQVLGADFWIRKQINSVQYRKTTVNGHEAVWINESHLMFNPPDYRSGNRPAARLVTQNTLIWTADQLTYRLETDLSLEAAQKIAESLR